MVWSEVGTEIEYVRYFRKDVGIGIEVGVIEVGTGGFLRLQGRARLDCRLFNEIVRNFQFMVQSPGFISAVLYQPLPGGSAPLKTLP